MPRPAGLPLGLGLAAGLALAVSLLGAAELAAPASSQRARVHDRTFRCTVPLRAGLRLVGVAGQSGVRDQAEPSKWFALAQVSLSVQGASLAGVQAGAPRVERGVPQAEATLSIGTEVCKPAFARLSPSPRGLDGGLFNRFAEYYKCETPRRILLRVRAEFRLPVSLRSRRGYLWTEAPVRKGYVAIHSEQGKPLLYADVLESGRARLFFAGNCQRD